MFNAIRLDFYNSLTYIPIGESGAYLWPSVMFSIQPDDVIDFDISPEVGTADDLFEIHGRTANFVLARQGEFGAFMASKSVNPLYPHYLNTIVDVINVNTGELIMRGAVPLEFISYDYNKNLSTITIIDAISIWVREARNTYFEFASEGIYRRSCTFGFDTGSGAPLSIARIMQDPVEKMAWGLDNAMPADMVFDIGFGVVNDFHLLVDGYNDDLSEWEPDTYYGDWSWKGHFPQVNYNAEQRKFSIFMVFIYRGGRHNEAHEWFWRLEYKQIELYLDSTFQPKVVRTYKSELFDDPWKLEYLLKDIYGVGKYSISAYTPPYVIQNTMMRTVVSGGQNYTVEVALVDGRYEIHFSGGVSMKEIFMRSGSISYDRILHAMLTINGLTMVTREGAIKLQKSIVSTDYFDSSTWVDINDPVDLTTSGTYADISRITRAVDVAVASDNLKQALSEIYLGTLKRIATKFRFYVPAYLSEWRYYAPFSRAAFLEVSSNTTRKILITQRSYPENGVFLVEGVAEWDR